MENSAFGMAAYGLMLATMDMLENKHLLNHGDVKSIVQMASETIEQLAMTANRPEMMHAAEILHGIYGIDDIHHKKS